MKPQNIRAHWIHFAVSVSTMLVLAGFTIWRAAVTAWRSVPDRFYFFPSDNWLGFVDHQWFGDALRIIDRSWLNDFLLGPGIVACFFVAFTALYLVDGLIRQDTPCILPSRRSPWNDTSWTEHKRLMKIILYGLLVKAWIGGWGEEVGIFSSDLVFDPWDLTVELGGIICGAWLVHTLSYPKFSNVPPFSPDAGIPSFRDLPGRFGIDMLSVLATGIYVVLVDPFELTPLSLTERQVLALEMAIVFILFREGLKRGMNPVTDSISIGPLVPAPGK